MKKDKNDINNTENEFPCTSSAMQCSINVDINGFNISLNPHSNPPKAEDLFHTMFFEEELPKAPTHYRQQRWNKRRIQKRWNWKRGKEREVYEKRAEYLKNKWMEMKKHYKANNSKLSKAFLEKNGNLKINLNENENIIEIKTNSPHSVHESDHSPNSDKELDFSVLSSIDQNKNQNKSNQNKNMKKIHLNESKKLSKIEGKRKHIRRREKLIERIANGETLDDFVDHQKFNNIYNNNADSEKDNLLFSGTQSNTKKSKSKKSKKRHKNNNIAPMKLADFVQAANHRKWSKNDNPSETKKNQNNNNMNIEAESSHNKVSLDDIQAEQIKDFEALTRKKRNEIHNGIISNSSLLFSNKVKKGGTISNKENQCADNPLLKHCMKITNCDDVAFRSKTINEIYCGSSVFSCIPCCADPSNTLLIEAVYIEILLQPHSTLSNLSGLFELKKRLKKQYNNQIIEVLPIFERAYVDKQCKEFLLIQFQDNIAEDNDNINCALSLYLSWKQQIQQETNNNNTNSIRIDFVEKWFAKAYILQHSHLWSDVALASNTTVYDNNDKYIQTINKKARHCGCSFKRIIYFPPFCGVNTEYKQHDTKCILRCCCCMFYHNGSGNDDNCNESNDISNGNGVLWHGRKCIVHSKLGYCNQDCRIEIDQFVGKYVVALSSLQTFKQTKHNQSDSDAQKHILDDLSFVLYIKHFWNIV